MSALICGSLAYDTIMVFPDQFKNHILPGKVHILNVSFNVPQMRREFGGVAGNISYNLHLLGENPYPMATVGDDFGPYRKHLDELGISRRYIRHMEGEFTPQAFITTDIDDNQITAFHPGAMQHSHLNRIADTEGMRVGIVAPDGKQAMIQHSRDFVEQGIPHIFDPGQGMTLFNGDELRQFITEAKYLVVRMLTWSSTGSASTTARPAGFRPSACQAVRPSTRRRSGSPVAARWRTCRANRSRTSTKTP